jgi:cytochrome P450
MPLPMEVIFTLLGVPEGDRRQLREWMDVSLERDRDTPAIPERALIAMMQMMQYWPDFIEGLRRKPDDGLVSALLTAEVEDDDGTPTRLTDGEIIGFCNLIGSAGNETVTKLSANACVLFARHPRAVPDDPRRPRSDPRRRRGGAALHVAVAVSGPHDHA